MTFLSHISEKAGPRIHFWGTYDLGKPRTRILLEGLGQIGLPVSQDHVDIWEGIEDKTRIWGTIAVLRRLLRAILGYPRLIFRLLRGERASLLLVPYPGVLDVLILKPFAWLRRQPVVLDAFTPLYETVVDDRGLLGPGNPLAAVIWLLEWCASHVADAVLMDTEAHADAYAQRFHLARHCVCVVKVGVEPSAFPRRCGDARRVEAAGSQLRVLFYGQFVPLHGVDVIVRAAQLCRDRSIRWTIIGTGQVAGQVRKLLRRDPVEQLEWIPWVEYEELHRRIMEAELCLGIFGGTAKAARVIPNKVFQVIHMGKPIITRDSPAIRELLHGEMLGVYLVPPEDPQAILAAVEIYKHEREALASLDLHAEVIPQILPKAVARDFESAMRARRLI